MTNFETGENDEPDPMLGAFDDIIETFGVEPSASRPKPPSIPSPRASDIREELIPDRPTEADILWLQALLRDEPLVAMTTKGSKATIPMYSTFTTAPDGKLKFLFRSFESTDHATVIDEAVAAGLGRAAIQLLVYRSSVLNVGVELFGYASRVPEDKIDEYEEIYHRTRLRRGHRRGEMWGEPTYPMYVIDGWETAQMQTRLRNAAGEHISNGKVEIPLEQLLGFETPPDDEPTRSDQSWR